MTALDDTVAVLERALGGFRPEVAIVLGSGLAAVAERIERRCRLPFEDLPGFPCPAVEGHGRELVAGRLAGVPVLCLLGRHHLYEGGDPHAVLLPIRCLQRVGCRSLLLTNAAGSLHADLPVGGLMVIRDHLNWSGRNPLVGANDETIGPRFPDMSAAWDPDLRDALHAAGCEAGVGLAEGVYVMALGPNFETPAEVRALARLGGDAVGMSTVPECIAARHCGLRVAGLSMVTNAGAGLREGHELHHGETLAAGARLGGDVARVIECWLPRVGS